MRVVLAIAFIWTANAASTVAAKTPLWAVEDRDNVVYLLASIHWSPKSIQPFSQVIEQAHDVSSAVVFELDMGREQEMQPGDAIRRDARYPAHDSLKNHVSPPTLRLLKRTLEELNLDFEQACLYRPAFVADLVLVASLEKEGIRRDYGPDTYFFGRARKGGKQIRWLETAKDQTAFYRKLGDTEAESYLLGVLQNLHTGKKMVLRMARAWKKGATEEIEALVNAEVATNPNISKAMFLERSRRWLPKIEAMIASGENHFVVVGAAHLLGRFGILEILRHKGYRVRQL